MCMHIGSYFCKLNSFRWLLNALFYASPEILETSAKVPIPSGFMLCWAPFPACRGAEGFDFDTSTPRPLCIVSDWSNSPLVSIWLVKGTFCRFVMHSMCTLCRSGVCVGWAFASFYTGSYIIAVLLVPMWYLNLQIQSDISVSRLTRPIHIKRCQINRQKVANFYKIWKYEKEPGVDNF